MKEALVHPDTSVTIQDSPVPSPGPREVLVKVAVAGTNPKDWKFPIFRNEPQNSGDDLAGTVEAVGGEVCEFRQGDRVAGMHKYGLPHGAFAEYAVVSDTMLLHVPGETSFEEAATVPLAALTAAYALFQYLGLPAPWERPLSQRTALVIYGVSTAVGAFAVKLARAAQIHPLVAIGSPNSAFVREYLDAAEGDAFVDYRAYERPEELAAAIRAALAGAGVPDGPALHGLDAVSVPGTYDAVLGRAMAGDGAAGAPRPKIAIVTPVQAEWPGHPGVDYEYVSCGQSFKGEPYERRYSAVVFRMFSEGLREGWLRGHPYEVKPGGLEGVEAAMNELKENKVRARKLLLRIAETPGLAH